MEVSSSIATDNSSQRLKGHGITPEVGRRRHRKCQEITEVTRKKGRGDPIG